MIVVFAFRKADNFTFSILKDTLRSQNTRILEFCQIFPFFLFSQIILKDTLRGQNVLLIILLFHTYGHIEGPIMAFLCLNMSKVAQPRRYFDRAIEKDTIKFADTHISL